MDRLPYKPSRRELMRLALAGSVVGLAGTSPAWAQQSDGKKAEDLVTECALAIEDMLASKDEPALKNLPSYIERARAVMIYPAIFKGGFIIGGEGGSGVLLARGVDGSWSSPAFYTLAGGSIGLQIGGQVSKVCFTVMTDGGLDAILSNNVKFGADLSVAVGPFGAGAEAATTTNLDADVYSFSSAVGLFGGGSLAGAAMIVRESFMQGYYGTAVTARQIVVDRKFSNPQANRLRGALAV